CSKPYSINRSNLHQYLFIYVKSGRMELQYKNKTFTIGAHMLFFLDCREHHIYRALEETEFSYIHFNGVASKEYFELLYKSKGIVFSLFDNLSISEYIDKILDDMKLNQLEEQETSILIHKILYELYIVSHQSYNLLDNAIKKVIIYIKNNYMKNINVENMAQYVHLSRYHFSRIFKKHTNLSPHQYLIKIRINEAKSLLYLTDDSITEIAMKCGFSSLPHFVSTFKKHSGFSAKEFRNLR